MTMNIRIFSRAKRRKTARGHLCLLSATMGLRRPGMSLRGALHRCIGAKNPLPQWYWMQDGDSIVGCAGLITNDFISRGELWPWLCALYIDPRYRGHGLAFRLIEHIAQQAKQLGFMQLHLCTDPEGLYEKAGFYFDGPGYHPWGSLTGLQS